MASLELVTQSLISGILLGGVYACFGIGVSLLWGVMRVGNFAHGALAFLGTYLFYTLLTSYGLDPLMAMLLLVPLFFCLGVIIFEAIIHPAYMRLKGAEFENSCMLMTFGLAMMIESVISFFWGTDILSIPSGSLRYFGGRESLRIGPIFLPKLGMVSLFSAIVSIVVLKVFLERTYTGLAIRATAQNREMAGALGVKVHNIWLICVGISGVLACMAGMTMSMSYAFYPQGGLLWCIKAFIVVTMGGIGSISGTLVGGLILGISENLACTLLPVALPNIPILPICFRDVIALTMFLILLILRPKGLFVKG